MFHAPHHLKADARLVGKMLTMGVLDEETAKQQVAAMMLLLRKATHKAVTAPDDKDGNKLRRVETRVATSMLKPIAALLKLELDHLKFMFPEQAPAPNVNVNVGVQVVQDDDWYGTADRISHAKQSGNGRHVAVSSNGHDAEGD